MNPKQEAQQYWSTWQQKYGEDIANDEDWYRQQGRTPGYIYVLKAGHFYKIGRSIDPLKRFPQISLKMPFITRMWTIWWAPDMIWLESVLHEFYDQYRVNGEWFALPEREAEVIKNEDPLLAYWLLYEIINTRTPHSYWGDFNLAVKHMQDFLSWWGKFTTHAIEMSEEA